MGATLNTAVGMSAYTLTDRATWIAFGNKGDFTIHVEGDARLFNQYGVILVNPDKHPHVKAAARPGVHRLECSARGPGCDRLIRDRRTTALLPEREPGRIGQALSRRKGAQPPL